MSRERLVEALHLALADQTPLPVPSVESFGLALDPEALQTAQRFLSNPIVPDFRREHVLQAIRDNPDLEPFNDYFHSAGGLT
jgi:hypothetical protein